MPNSFLQILTQRLNREQQESQFARSLAEQALSRQSQALSQQSQEQLTREGRQVQQAQWNKTFEQQKLEYEQAQKAAAFNAVSSGAAVPAATEKRDRLGVETALGIPLKRLDSLVGPGTYQTIGGQELAATTPQSRSALTNKELLKRETAELELKSTHDTKRRQEYAKAFDQYDTALGNPYNPEVKKRMMLQILIPGLPKDPEYDPKNIAGQAMYDVVHAPTPELKAAARKMLDLAKEYAEVQRIQYPSPSFQLESNSHRLSGEIMPRARDLTTQVKAQLGESNTLSDAQIQTMIAQKLLENRISRREVDSAAASKALENIRTILGAPSITTDPKAWITGGDEATKKLGAIISTIKD